MLAVASSYQARQDLKTRKHLMERSFAWSTRYGFDRARWRGLWKVSIQEYLISAIQNIETLIRHGRKPTRGVLSLIPVNLFFKGASWLEECRMNLCLFMIPGVILSLKPSRCDDHGMWQYRIRA
jgi:hypothetical protein